VRLFEQIGQHTRKRGSYFGEEMPEENQDKSYHFKKHLKYTDREKEKAKLRL